MRTRKNLLLILLLPLLLLASCARPGTPLPATAAPQETPASAATVSAPTAVALPTRTPLPGDEARAEAAAVEYFQDVADGELESASARVSAFSLMVLQMTSGDALAALEADQDAGLRWSGLQLLGARRFDDQSMLVHVKYTLTRTDAGTPAAADAASEPVAESVDALWVMRSENNEWRFNWNNLVDFHSLAIKAQTAYGITLLPLELRRYSDQIELTLLAQNRSAELVVFGQTNETLGAFQFGSGTVTAEPVRWVLSPNQSAPSVSLVIRGFFEEYPDSVEIRRWNAAGSQPWYTFELK